MLEDENRLVRVGLRRGVKLLRNPVERVLVIAVATGSLLRRNRDKTEPVDFVNFIRRKLHNLFPAFLLRRRAVELVVPHADHFFGARLDAFVERLFEERNFFVVTMIGHVAGDEKRVEFRVILLRRIVVHERDGSLKTLAFGAVGVLFEVNIAHCGEA